MVASSNKILKDEKSLELNTLLIWGGGERERETVEKTCAVASQTKLGLWHILFGDIYVSLNIHRGMPVIQAMFHFVFHFSGDLALFSDSLFFMHNLLFQSNSFLRNVALKGNEKHFP